MNYAILIFAICIGVNLRKCYGYGTATVDTTSGMITGNYSNTTYGDMYMFRGIPYAEPPVGILRFKEPVMASYKGKINAFEFGSVCIQQSNEDDGSMAGSEDCLFINVFSPNLTANPPLPVIVYIHGGGYVDGAGSAIPYTNLIAKQFLRKNVIAVSINYRLNAFGFLNANNSDLPANNAMKDQVLALKWVQLNIAKFGGDPNRVTIQGESAGASSVGLHIYSPLSKGLFNQVIMESGTAFVKWAMISNEYDMFFDRSAMVSKRLGCDLSNLECLRQKTAQEIHNADLAADHSPIPSMVDWAPIVDGKGGFMPDYPGNINSYRASVNILVGSNHDEFAGVDVPPMGGTLAAAARNRLSAVIPDQFSAHYEADAVTGFREIIYHYCTDESVENSNVTDNLGLSYDVNSTTNFTKQYYDYNLRSYINKLTYGYLASIAQEEITNEYCGGRMPFNASDWEAWLNATCQTMTNNWVNYGTRMEVEEALKHNASTVAYMYSFNYASPSFEWYNFWPGVVHASELPFVFGLSYYPFFDVKTNFTKSDYDVEELFSKAWTNFVKTGNPNTPEPLGSTWDPVRSIDYMPYYAIDIVSSTHDNYHYEDYQFWKTMETLRQQYRNNPVLPTTNPVMPTTNAVMPTTNAVMPTTNPVLPTTSGHGEAVITFHKSALVSALFFLAASLLF